MKTFKDYLSEAELAVETIRRYGAVGTRDASGLGSAFGEDQDAEVLGQKELATDVTNPMPGVHENYRSDETLPVERAILHRILMQHPSLLAQHGPAAVMDAARDMAEQIGDVDEIGSSDVSGWVRELIRQLGSQESM